MAVSFDWLQLNRISQHWSPPDEYGVDIAIPTGTTITSLTSGTIENYGYYGGGGVVSIKTSIGGKPQTVYYQHLDLIADGLVPGASVKPGDYLGLSGGQLSGGHHPSSPQYSSGAHVEVGLNAPYGSIWGAAYGPNVDPLPWLKTVSSGGGGTGLQGLSNLPLTPKGDAQDQIGAALQLIDSASEVHDPFKTIDAGLNPIGWLTQAGTNVAEDVRGLLVRAIVVIVGVFLIIIVLKSLLDASGITQKIQSFSQEAGQAALLA